MCDMGRVMEESVALFFNKITEERKLLFSDLHLICLEIKIKR